MSLVVSHPPPHTHTNKQFLSLTRWQSERLQKYFSLGSCMSGLDVISQSLFGVTLQPVAAAHGEVDCCLLNCGCASSVPCLLTHCTAR